MADVAVRAGVSIATVSRALRDVPGVGGETRERVKQIARELSYVVSPEASRLAGGATGRIGVVVPRIGIWFYAEMLSSIEATLRTAELDVLIYQVQDEQERARFFQELPARRKVDAVILIALPLLQEELDRLDLLGVDVVVAGGRVHDFPHVEIDDHAVAVTAVEHLMGLGHERIAMIRTVHVDERHWPAAERSRGYEDVLAAAGLSVRPEYVVSVPYTIDAGRHAAEQLLALDEPPTAVFAFSDEIAVGVIEAARRAKVDVPEQLSVIGVDDHPLAEVLGITTVRQDIAEQGRLSAQMALDLVLGKDIGARAVVVPHELVVRSSTAPPAR